MRTITVYMSDGDTIDTEINGTDQEIIRHYLGNRFEAGSDTKHHVALCIVQNENGRYIDWIAAYSLRFDDENQKGLFDASP